jgi:hypothetical protein
MGFVFHRSWTLPETHCISRRYLQLTEHSFQLTSKCNCRSTGSFVCSRNVSLLRLHLFFVTYRHWLSRPGEHYARVWTIDNVRTEP